MAITKDDILNAANEIERAGNEPTMASIREFLGNTGSFATISPVLREWKESRKTTQAVVVEMPGELKAVMDKLGVEFWQTASGIANEKLTAVEAAKDEAVRTAEDGRDEILQELTRLESALETTTQERAKMEAEKQSAHDQIGELKAGTIRFEEKLSACQIEGSQLRDNLTQMTAEKDRQADEASRLLGLNSELKREYQECQHKGEEQHRKVIELSALNGSLNDQLEQVKGERETLKADNSKQADDLLKLKTTVSGLEARIDDRNIKVEQLETTNTRLQKESQKLATLEAELKASQSRVRELAQESGELKQENKMLHGEVGKLKGELNAAKK